MRQMLRAISCTAYKRLYVMGGIPLIARAVQGYSCDPDVECRNFAATLIQNMCAFNTVVGRALAEAGCIAPLIATGVHYG
jgi:hypothetical protein